MIRYDIISKTTDTKIYGTTVVATFKKLFLAFSSQRYLITKAFFSFRLIS